jgi:hypothetical protein
MRKKSRFMRRSMFEHTRTGNPVQGRRSTATSPFNYLPKANRTEKTQRTAGFCLPDHGEVSRFPEASRGNTRSNVMLQIGRAFLLRAGKASIMRWIAT